ncbi:winged helix-turn-helix transcriptional regulator [Enterococcus entomosocium]|uniref:winged helix-turn-helix transcriptional regulator n=1 Tax=Enterococcus entomosocium TaxID=3034352 RepID=UPI003BDAA808
MQSYNTIRSIEIFRKGRAYYRTEHDEIVPRLEYLLTELGRSLLPVYEVIGNWYEDTRAILELG